MTADLWGSFLAGLGLLLVIRAQPLGRPRPTLKARLDALRPRPAPAPEQDALLGRPELDRVVVPALSLLGATALAGAARLGVDPAVAARELRRAGEPYGVAVLWGQKVAGLVTGTLLVAALQGAGLGPRWALLWVVGPGAGFWGPDIGLRARARKRRRELLSGLAVAVRLLSLAVSAGYGLEQALAEVASSGEGPFFDDISRAIARARTEGSTGVDALGEVARCWDVPELIAFAGVLGAASRQGGPIAPTLRAQAAGLRSRWRVSLVEAGERAAVTMLLPIGLLILPAFFLVVLYPAAANLLQLSDL